MSLADKILASAEPPRDTIARTLREYLAQFDSVDATAESLRAAHLKFFQSVQSWTRLTEHVSLPIDAAPLAGMDVRYREDGRGVERVTITAKSLDQMEALANFIRILENELRAEKAKAAARGLLEIT
jgi:hypothetical protein